MKSMSYRILGACLLAIVSARAPGTICASDQTPAGTLLFPHVQIDLSDNSTGVTTQLKIRNQSPDPHLGNLTLWSRHGVPVFAFPIYFGGFDTVSIDVRELVLGAQTPLTGPERLGKSSLANPNQTFPNCSISTPPSINALNTNTADELRKALLGEASQLLGGNCATTPLGYDTAFLYVTLDHVTQCGVGHPGEPSYYGGELGFANAFTGTYRFVDPANNFAWGQPAVHIEAADAAIFGSGDATFYGKFTGDPSDASDRREPLPTALSLSVPATGNEFTEIMALTWREPKRSAVGGFACFTGGFGLQLGFSGELTQAAGESDPFVAISGSGSVLAAGSNLPDFEEPKLPVPESFGLDISSLFGGNVGRFLMNLQADTDSPSTFGQAWAMMLNVQSGRFVSATAATPLDDNCPASSQTVVERPGPSTIDRLGSPLFHDSLESLPRWSEL